jgi:hypothetical protein
LFNLSYHCLAFWKNPSAAAEVPVVILELFASKLGSNVTSIFSSKVTSQRPSLLLQLQLCYFNYSFMAGLFDTASRAMPALNIGPKNSAQAYLLEFV